MLDNDKLNVYQDNLVVLLGIGQETKILLELFKTNRINIDYICDNKPNIDKDFENIPFIKPQNLKQLAQSKNDQSSGGGREKLLYKLLYQI